MRDLDDLEAMIRNASARQHYREAVLAMRAGAYRAAIVQTWISVTVDLIEKVRLRAENDTWVHSLNNALKNQDIKAMSGCERELIKNARRLQLLTSAEARMLERLREDRNMCAHPAFANVGETFSPTPELVRSHLAAAVDNCLSIPPIVGKEVIERLKNDIDSRSWPIIDALPVFLKQRYFTYVREATMQQLAKFIIKSAIEPPKSSELHQVDSETFAARCCDAIGALHDFNSPLLRQSVKSVYENWSRSGKLRDATILSMMGALGNFEWFWDMTDKAFLAEVEALLERCDLDYLVQNRAFACGSPCNQRAMEAMKDCLANDEANPQSLSRVAHQIRHDLSVVVPAAIQSLHGAHSFRDGEARLRLLLKLAPALTAEDVKSASTYIRENNQIYEASDVPAILENLYQETKDLVGMQEAWESLARGLNADYVDRTGSSEGYYSYSKLVTLVCHDA